ncbi:hypothetical protein [Variovorax paradoxus]|uniref:hypothetical protein n=1 Tax=Variovorax paradoxus TaxID=34073 RepID=UPI003D659497
MQFVDIPDGIPNPESRLADALSAKQHAARAPGVAAITGTIREEQRDEQAIFSGDLERSARNAGCRS